MLIRNIAVRSRRLSPLHWHLAVYDLLGEASTACRASWRYYCFHRNRIRPDTESSASSTIDLDTALALLHHVQYM